MPLDVDIGVERERAGGACRVGDVLGLGRADERGVHRRRGRRLRLETERELPGPCRRRKHRSTRERRVGRWQAPHQAAEREIAEQVEYGGAVIATPARAIGLGLHGKVGDDRRHHAALEYLLSVRAKVLTQLWGEAREVRVHALEVAVLRDE